MKVINHIEIAKMRQAPRFSYEIVPPARGKSLTKIIEIIEHLVPFNPPYIDVTAHAATMTYTELDDGTIQKSKIRKRPGTIGICGAIQNRFNIDTVAHLLCQGFTKEETEDAMIELGFLGIHNILALKGDTPNFSKADSEHLNQFAVELVEQVSNINQGVFLTDSEVDSTLDFCIGVAGYPEKHFEAPNMKEDIRRLKAKVDQGAEYITTQMFFDNKLYFDFVQQARDAGIEVPIIPGLKVITNTKQLSVMAQKFHIDLPNSLVDELMANPTHAREIGRQHAIMQSEELLNQGVPIIHYYVMNSPTVVTDVIKKLQI